MLHLEGTQPSLAPPPPPLLSIPLILLGIFYILCPLCHLGSFSPVPSCRDLHSQHFVDNTSCLIDPLAWVAVVAPIIFDHLPSTAPLDDGIFFCTMSLHLHTSLGSVLGSLIWPSPSGGHIKTPQGLREVAQRLRTHTVLAEASTDISTACNFSSREIWRLWPSRLPSITCAHMHTQIYMYT